MRRLRQDGAGASDAVRLDEVRSPGRYPVALRAAAGGGWLSGRLETPAALDAARAELDRQGISRRRVMAVELAEPERASRALVVGERVLGLGRGPGDEPAPPAALLAVAGLAGLDYGRLDYGVLDGRLAVWGLDTDPPLDEDAPAVGDLAAALRALDTGAGTRVRGVSTGLPPRGRGPAMLRGPRERLAERLKELSDRLPRR